jgi:hypothetical protein
MEVILIEWLGGRLLDWLPGWLVRRFVRLDSIARQVRLQPRSKSPLTFGLTEQTPAVHVWFQVENHSSIDLMLDRVVLDVWAGQPVAYGVMAHRTRVLKHSTMSQVPPFVGALTPAAIEQIKRHQQEQPPKAYSINASAYFDSKLGPFSVQLVGFDGEVQAG